MLYNSNERTPFLLSFSLPPLFCANFPPVFGPLLYSSFISPLALGYLLHLLKYSIQGIPEIRPLGSFSSRLDPTSRHNSVESIFFLFLSTYSYVFLFFLFIFVSRL